MPTRLVHIVTNSRMSFLFANKLYFTHTYNIFFTYASVNGHGVYFHFLAIINSGEHEDYYLFKIVILFPSYIYLDVEL